MYEFSINIYIIASDINKGMAYFKRDCFFQADFVPRQVNAYTCTSRSRPTAEQSGGLLVVVAAAVVVSALLLLLLIIIVTYIEPFCVCLT